MIGKNNIYSEGEVDYIFIRLVVDNKRDICFLVDDVVQECCTRGWVLAAVCSEVLIFVNEGVLPFNSNVIFSRADLVGHLISIFSNIVVVHGRQSALRGMTTGGSSSIIRFNVIFDSFKDKIINLFSMDAGSVVEL